MPVTLAEWRKKGQGLKNQKEYPVEKAYQAAVAGIVTIQARTML
jgi:hypothetical protein